MQNDRNFHLYASGLVLGVVALLSSLAIAGITQVPSLLVFLEHFALGIAFRTAYKSLDPDFQLNPFAVEPAMAAPEADLAADGADEKLAA